MAAALGEHPSGMTSRYTGLSLTALLSLTCVSYLGCDAPEKTVGQETVGATDSGTGSGSGSDTQNCDGELPCGTESDSDSTTTGSETDPVIPENCETLDNASDCASEGCAWQDTSLISSDGAACDVSEGEGYCFDPGTGETEAGCGGVFCGASNNEYWTREIEDGTWEVVGGDCFLPIPDGFVRCEYDGADPVACGCACPEDGATLPSGFESTLGASGCADMTVFGANPDGSIGLALSTGAGFTPVADAVAAGETTSTTHDVSEFARVSVYVGTNVTYPECNDALEPSAYAIDQEWVATSGTVQIEIVPEPDPIEFGTEGFATVTISDLEVTYAGATESLGTVVFEDVAVGWLPG
jgi:hypothetical protein